MKTKMKAKMKAKMILVLMLVSLGQTAHSQGMPVYDNTSFLALGKSLIESAKQTSELLKTARFLKEQKERIERVNNVVKQARAVREITNNNQELFDMVQKELREIINSPYIRAGEVDRISESFNSIIERSLEDLDFMQQVLTSDFLNMTDSERLEVLEAQKERSREMVSEIRLRTKRYRTIISFREMQGWINTRDTNH